MAVEEVGGIACIVYNNTTGTINMDLSDSTATIPCVSIQQSDAVKILEKSEAIQAEDGTVYYTGKITVSGTTVQGEGIYFSFPEEFVKILSKVVVESTDLKFEGVKL